MNLHDWIDELCDVLDLETEVDEGLLNDLATLSYEQVDHLAGPVTTYLLGFAAGATEAGPATVEKLAARAQALAESWDRPAGEVAADDVDVAVDLDDSDLVVDVDDEDEDREENE